MKVKKTEKNNKSVIIVVVIVIVAIVVGVILGLGKRGNEKELESSLNKMGKNFYENFYYKQVGSSSEERSSLLSKFSTIGIKIDLDNLSRYNDGEFKKEINKFVNSKTGEKCNKTKTKVTIYPKSPYGKTDYTVKADLDCGFSKKK